MSFGIQNAASGVPDHSEEMMRGDFVVWHSWIHLRDPYIFGLLRMLKRQDFAAELPPWRRGALDAEEIHRVVGRGSGAVISVWCIVAGCHQWLSIGEGC